jgi:hypothetical protein
MQLKQRLYWYECALKRVDVVQCKGYTECNLATLCSWANNVEVQSCTIMSTTKRKDQQHNTNKKIILQF